MEKFLEENLGPKDERKRSYEGRLDKTYGMMLMSKKKLIFFTEKGFFRKSYNLILNLPYEKIKSLRTEKKYNLIIETEDLKHTFVSSARYSPGIEEVLRELMEQEPSQDI